MVFAQNTSRRKRPMCHRCGSTMAGHTRKNNMFICPGPAESKSHLLLSPDSPPPTYEFHGFQVPPGDRWHWRNPNWVSPPRERPHEKAHRDVSLTPTEPLSDEGPGKENISPFPMEHSPSPDYTSDDWAGSSDSLDYYPNFSIKEESPEPHLNTALRGGTPLYSVYRVPRQDVPKVQRTAQREGKLFSVMTAPPAHLAKIPREKSRETVWVILSDREEDLQYASMYSIPGGLAVQENLRSAGHGFLQMAFAGIIGGLVVTYGRALL
ncbi:uncharacterized protein BJ212DRAFT_1272666 [Suillus subaureus]|uniref:Uncharacterized protein n=1 Tax=Suillus subaureus TaxID=48587 RepID=A0A9P7EA79_9AGAM|nr:uncharacterized protein BJ212DRAFT_1272666 [Suillus subaureus]KAG1815685.1 hypothetical protein BJ212DRAFT_1272666 [Suillus subaureus]